MKQLNTAKSSNEEKGNGLLNKIALIEKPLIDRQVLPGAKDDYAINCNNANEALSGAVNFAYKSVSTIADQSDQLLMKDLRPLLPHYPIYTASLPYQNRKPMTAEARFLENRIRLAKARARSQKRGHYSPTLTMTLGNITSQNVSN